MMCLCETDLVTLPSVLFPAFDNTHSVKKKWIILYACKCHMVVFIGMFETKKKS